MQALLREVPLRAAARVELDFPRLMSRVHAVRQTQLVPVKERLTDQFLGRTDALGRVSVAARAAGQLGDPAPRARCPAGSWKRRRGWRPSVCCPPTPSSVSRPGSRSGEAGAAASAHGGTVSVFPTCFVEYMEPDIGRAIVEVYEHNGVACALPEGTKCCGAPWLHSGRVDEFTKAARTQRVGPGRRGAGGPRHHCGPAHLRVCREAGLPDLREGPGGRPGGRAHLRSGRYT